MSGQRQRKFGAAPTACVLLILPNTKQDAELARVSKGGSLVAFYHLLKLPWHLFSPASVSFYLLIFLEKAEDVHHAMPQSPDSQVPAPGTIAPSGPHGQTSFLCK